jgi:hypothetical protein
MGAPGERVVLADGSFAVLADGSFAVYNAAGTCTECCGGGGPGGPCDCDPADFYYTATFSGSMSEFNGTYRADSRIDGPGAAKFVFASGPLASIVVRLADCACLEMAIRQVTGASITYYFHTDAGCSWTGDKWTSLPPGTDWWFTAFSYGCA